MSGLRVLVAGGGIGGLTAALCLAKHGFVVDVFEQSAAFDEIGAGIQLSPNCTRVLRDLGLEPALAANAFLPQMVEFRDWRSGRVISSSPLGAAVVDAYGAAYYHIHRGDLLRVLVDAAKASDNIRLHLDSRVEDLEQTEATVQLTTRHGAFEADVLVGADGIRSVVRTALWGEQQPRFTGNVAWRALVPAERLPDGMVRPASTAWWGPHKHFVHYYVRGGALVNCVCVVEKSGWTVESWTEPGDYSELKADFSGWHPDIQTLIDSADRDSLFKWALYDRDPMTRWGRGRVTLLGDACHPTLPFMAQGAAMAIEDGAVLAAALAAGADVPAALDRYENLRRPRTAGIQNGSRRNASTFHLTGIKAWLRNRAAGAAGQGTMRRLYSYNALEAVNLRSSAPGKPS